MESSYWLRSQKTESQQCLGSTSKKKKIKKSTAGGSVNNNPFESLPTEILQKILGYLPVHDRVRVERVCKRWKNVSTERVWGDVQALYIMRPEFGTKSYRFRESLEKFSEFIRVDDNKLFIGIDKIEIINSLVSRAGQYVKKIIFFVDPDEGPTKPVLSIIAAHCHNIEFFVIDEVEKSAIGVFLRLIRANKQLRSIMYIYASNIIERLPLRDWKSLHFFISGEKGEEIWNNRLVSLIENSPSLEALRTPYWTTDIVAAISKCEQFKNLDIYHCELYDEIMIPSLLNRLTHLKLAFNRHKLDLIIDLLRSCINLKHLSFHPGDDNLPLEVVQAVLTLPKLESLELQCQTTCSIIDEIGILSRSSNFKCLNLNRCFFTPPYENEIFEMIPNWKCLKKLDMTEIYVTAELFEKLVKDTRERSKVLEIEVSSRIYEEAFRICKGSKIHITQMKL